MYGILGYSCAARMNRQRLQSLLKDSGYVLAYNCRATRQVVFVRRRVGNGDVFERILITASKAASSSKWEWFGADAQTAIVPGYSAVKGICESRYISDLP